jgi:hypothetical protein
LKVAYASQATAVFGVITGFTCAGFVKGPSIHDCW